MTGTPVAETPAADLALAELLGRLAAMDYQFVAPSPATHRRVLLRRGRTYARNIEDVFGWSLPFRAPLLDASLRILMEAGQILRRRGEILSSTLRAAKVGGDLFLHSAFPARAKDAVFLGPDSYRFVDFVRAEAPPLAPDAAVLDLGAGAGVGGVFISRLQPAARVTMADVNPAALRLARINAAAAGRTPDLQLCDGAPRGPAAFDLIIANPPYMADGAGHTYSDGGGSLGAATSIEWARAAVQRLIVGGRLLLYSGSAIARGRDHLRQALAEVAEAAGCGFSYRELDADVFPTTLLHPAYWGVERIAAVGVVMVKRA